MSFVQVDQGVVTHRKTLRLAWLLGESRYMVVGRLVALWSRSLDSAISGELHDVDAEMLADITGWEGKPAELYEGLIAVGFLDLDDDGALRLHNWDQRMGQPIQRRADHAATQACYRQNQKAQIARLLKQQPGVDDGDADEETHVSMTSPSRHADVMRKSNASSG